MNNRFSLLGCSILLAANSNLLLAQQVEEQNIWSGSVEFGYVDTSGNTEETTIKSGADLDREKELWRYSVALSSLNSKTSNQRSAEKYFLSNRLAYQFSEHNYSFLYASYDDDRFSGYDYQATIAAGYGRRIYNNEVMKWDAEIGPGYRFSKVEDNSLAEDSEEVILRLFTKYEWNFSEHANFTQSINVDAGADNTISKSITALQVKVIGAVAIKLSYTIKYSEVVPAANKHADTETAVTVAYSF